MECPSDMIPKIIWIILQSVRALFFHPNESSQSSAFIYVTFLFERRKDGRITFSSVIVLRFPALSRSRLSVFMMKKRKVRKGFSRFWSARKKEREGEKMKGREVVVICGDHDRALSRNSRNILNEIYVLSINALLIVINLNAKTDWMAETAFECNRKSPNDESFVSIFP